MAHIDALFDVQFFQNVQKVFCICVQGGVAIEVEVVGVGVASAHQVEKYHSVVVFEQRDDVAPTGLVGAEAMAEDDGLRGVADDADVVLIEDGGRHVPVKETWRVGGGSMRNHGEG